MTLSYYAVLQYACVGSALNWGEVESILCGFLRLQGLRVQTSNWLRWNEILKNRCPASDMYVYVIIYIYTYIYIHMYVYVLHTYIHTSRPTILALRRWEPGLRVSGFGNKTLVSIF